MECVDWVNDEKDCLALESYLQLSLRSPSKKVVGLKDMDHVQLDFAAPPFLSFTTSVSHIYGW